MIIDCLYRGAQEMKTSRKPVLILGLICSLFLLAPVCSHGQVQQKIAFQDNEKLESIRDKIDRNGYGFTVGHNWVYDMSDDEKTRFFSRRASASSLGLAVSEDAGPLLDKLATVSLPSSFDWRNYNGHSYIGPIRNQGNCGSCYAFGAAATAEGTYNFAVGKYDSNCADFSESYIIWRLGSISPYSYHFSGCDGSDYEYSELQAITDIGIGYEADFPYTVTAPSSDAHSGDPVVRFDSWHRIPCGDVDAIKTAIMTYGVVDASVLVTSAFEAYSGGIYDDSNTTCTDASPCYYATTDHVIALVGWNDNGDAENNGYWILRNSWGTDWGEDGYMRIKYKAARVSCEAAYLVYSTEGKCAYSLSSTGASFTGSGGTGSVTVTAGSGCAWTATTSVSWATITSGASGSGNGSVYYTVSANSGASRTGVLTIAGEKLTIEQDAGYPITELENGALVANLSASEGSSVYYKVAVPSGATSLEVKTWGGSGDCDLYLRYGNAPTTSVYDYRDYYVGNNATITVANPKAGVWWIMLNAYDAFFGMSLQTTYTAPAPCSYELDPTVGSFGSSGGAGSVNVTAGAGCAWSASTTSTWIAIDSGSSSGTGDGAVSYLVAANTGAARSGTISIGGEVFTVTQEQGGSGVVIAPLLELLLGSE